MSSRVRDVGSPEYEPFTRLDGPAENGTVFRCPLCSARFTHGLQACPSCPINAGCSLVTCPNCNYAFPRTSRIVAWFQRRWNSVGNR